MKTEKEIKEKLRQATRNKMVHKRNGNDTCFVSNARVEAVLKWILEEEKC